MPNFGGIVITENGRALLAKAQAGKILNFSKMQLGSSNNTDSPETKTVVIDPFLTTAITELKVTGDGKARISTYITNQELTENHEWREIGLFAKDPDTNQEILYAYKSAGEYGETLPAGGGADIVEKIFDIIINVSNVSNVTAIIDGSAVYIKTRDICTTFEQCKEANDKVPSAKLMYDELESLKNKDKSLTNSISNLEKNINTSITKKISDLETKINTNTSSVTNIANSKTSYGDFVITTTPTYNIDNGHGGNVNHSDIVTKAGYFPIGVVGFTSSSKNHYNNTHMGACINNIYLSECKAGSCRINAQTYVANNGAWTYSSTYCAAILWVKVK